MSMYKGADASRVFAPGGIVELPSKHAVWARTDADPSAAGTPPIRAARSLRIQIPPKTGLQTLS